MCETTFFTTETVTKVVEERVETVPVVGKVYRFAGESYCGGNSRASRFMIVSMSGGANFIFHSGKVKIGWTPIEGPQAGTVFMFHDEEEIEEASD